jgi:hypothetical protein
VNRGSVLVETMLAILVAALLLQAVVAASRLEAAGEEAVEAAEMAVVWAARHGDVETAAAAVRSIAPGAQSVSILRRGDYITAIVRMTVTLTGPDGRGSTTVSGRAAAAVSPYRSNRD